MTEPHVVVHGAGLVGGFLGGALAHAGAKVTLLGRPRFLAPLTRGLRLTDLDRLDVQVAPERFTATADPACLAQADLVLVCVKASANPGVIAELARHARPGTQVVSFQNGVHNAQQLAQGAPRCDVVAGMVPFNITQPAPGHWHRATEGALHLSPHPAAAVLQPRWATANLELRLAPDMRAVLWAKVLLNLNNPINALSGVPLVAELADRDFRCVLAACMAEGLAAVRAAGIAPAQLTRVRPGAIPALLRLPTWLYSRLARRTLKIDPLARSSMAEDLERERATEIDEINGAVVKLGSAHGVKTPVNARVIELVRAAERGDRRRYTGRELRAAMPR